MENEGPFLDLPDNNFGMRNRSMTFNFPSAATHHFDLMNSLADPKQPINLPLNNSRVMNPHLNFDFDLHNT